MVLHRPKRIAGHSYVGGGRYHVRIGTWDRSPRFADAPVVEAACAQLLPTAKRWGFEVLAHCFMPDHVHLLLDAVCASADLERCVARWKQSTGFAYRRGHHGRLWQPGYFERVLRAEETTAAVSAYIVANPVRAGLARRVGDYPYAWAKGMGAPRVQG
jgi:putative transposase